MALLLGGCGTINAASQKPCQFAYTDKVREGVIVPYFRKEGIDLREYDMRQPAISQEADVATLIFYVPGVLDAELFVDIDTCSRRVLRSGSAVASRVGR